MEASGDHDPTRIQGETGQPLHFDATDSASTHRSGLRSNGAAASAAKDEAIDQAKDQAMEKAAEYAEHLAPALGALGPIVGAVGGLGTLYKKAIEGPAREGEAQRALGASDAGVVALAQSLKLDPQFKTFVAQGHNGSSNAAAAMAVTLQDPANASTLSKLQGRADRGLIDAAGYARNAAEATRPLLETAKAKLALAKQTSNPDTRATLVHEANEATLQASEVQKKIMAPVMNEARADAAYGLGVQLATFEATSGSSFLEGAVGAANARLHPVQPQTVQVQG
jgi:hypothetical protein